MQEEKKDNIEQNIPKGANKDIAKLKMDEATKALKKRIEEIKEMERQSGAPLSSEKLLGYMADIEKEFLATKIYNKLQTVLKEIEEKMSAYDAPINTAKKQIGRLAKNHEDLADMIKVAMKTVKAVGWILGAIVTIFTIANFFMRMFS